MPIPPPKYLFLATAITLICLAPTTHARENGNLKAAYELFEAMEMGETYEKTLDQMVDMQIKQAPQIAPLKHILVKFFRKHLGWQTIKKELAEIYTARFTVKELKELKKFYLTPLGKKTARLMPELTSLGAKIGERRVMENMAELQQMIVAEAKKQGLNLQ